MTDKELGIYGEMLAKKHLEKEGYQILKTNYRYLKLEIDIISKKDNKIIVTEVKTRQTAEIGEPWMAVTRKKQKQIITCADAYLKNNHIELDVQFDIVSIVHNQYRTKLEHIPNAFSA